MLGLIYRLAVYISPILMAGMEMSLNEVAKTGSTGSLLAPSLAAASLGLFLPSLKPVSGVLLGWKKTADGWVVGLAVTGLLMSFWVWHMLVAANLGASIPAWLPDWNIFGLGKATSVAIILYAVATFMAELKARVEV